MLKRPLLQTAMGSDALIAPSRNPLYRAMVRFALKRADAVWATSESVAAAVAALGLPRDRIHVFSEGVDVGLFSRRTSSSRLREELGWRAETPVVACTRNHEGVYGVEYLVEAVPMILAAHPEAKFLLAGSGSLSEKLVQRTKDLGAASSVAFVGRVAHEVLPEYLSIADVYVSPSLSDGTSVSLLEAMACELPVVVTDVSGNLEWVSHGVNGYVVPTRDPAALAVAVSRLLASTGTRRAFGCENAAIVRARASFVHGIERLEALYRMLAQSRA